MRSSITETGGSEVCQMGVVEENYYTCRGILGPFLLIDLRSGFAGAAVALLSVGVSVYCLSAETDSLRARGGRRNFGRDCTGQLLGGSVG